ncbi:hypothetical protein AAMO2058_000972200 [Amorphochlora amoebiformis]
MIEKRMNSVDPIKFLHRFVDIVLRCNPAALAHYLQDIVTAVSLYFHRAQQSFNLPVADIQTLPSPDRKTNTKAGFDGKGQERQAKIDELIRSGRAISELLDLVVVKSYDKYPKIFRTAIQSLTPLPKLWVFSKANLTRSSICQRDNFAKKVSRFVQSLTINVTNSGSPSSTLPMVSSLLQLLRQNRNEIVDFSGEREEDMGSSGGWQKGWLALAWLQRVLVGLCGDTNLGEEVRSLVGKCLGEIGALDCPQILSNVSQNSKIFRNLYPFGKNDDLKGTLTGANVGSHIKVLGWLDGLLRDSDPNIVITAASTLIKIFSCSKHDTAWRSLSLEERKQLTPYKEISHFEPSLHNQASKLATKKGRSSGGIRPSQAQGSGSSELEVAPPSNSELDRLWDPRGQTHSSWICNLTSAVAASVTDEILRSCAKICSLRPKFSSEILPSLIGDLVVYGGPARGLELTISEQVNRLVRCFLQDSKRVIDQRVLDDVLAIVHHLRKQRVLICRTHRRSDTLIEALEALTAQVNSLDFLQLAETAQRLGMPFSALMFVEAHQDGKPIAGGTDETENFLKVLHSKQNPAPFKAKGGGKGGGWNKQQVRSLLRKIFRKIDDPDAMYGVADGYLLESSPEGPPKKARIKKDEKTLRSPGGILDNPKKTQETSRSWKQVLLYEHEGAWSKAVHAYDSMCERADFKRDGNDSGGLKRKRENNDEDPVKLRRGLTDSLHHMGCSHVLLAYMNHLAASQPTVYSQLSERHYEAAWRASRWSVVSPVSSSSTSSFHSYFHQALGSLRDCNFRAFEQAAEAANAMAIQSLAQVARRTESFAMAAPYLTQLHLISDASQAANILRSSSTHSPDKKMKAFDMDVHPNVSPPPSWTMFQSLLTERIARLSGRFQLMEPVLALRTVLTELSRPDHLGPHLVSSARFSRQAGANFACRSILRRSERGGVEFLDVMRLGLEEAHLLWDEGEGNRAISMAMGLIKQLRSKPSTAFKGISTPSLIEFQVELHCLLGDWLSRTLSESPNVTSKVLEAAKNPIHGEDKSAPVPVLTPKQLHAVHYQLGRFHDHVYQRLLDQRDGVEFKTSRAVIERNHQKLKFLNENLRSKSNAGSVGSRRGLVYNKSELKGVMNTLRKNIEIDEKKHKALNTNITKSLDLAFKNYIQCLRQGGPDDRSALYRLISLWFANPEDESLSRQMCLASRASSPRKVGTHKFLPLVYQIASRLKHIPSSCGSSASTLKREALFRKTVYGLIKAMALKHPFHTLYQIFAIANGDKLPENTRLRKGFEVDLSRKRAAEQMLLELKDSERTAEVQAVGVLIDAFIELSLLKFSKNKRKTLGLKDVPIRRLGTNLLGVIPMPTADVPVNPSGDYTSVPKMAGFGNTIRFANTGVSRPMIFECRDTVGRLDRMLAKPRDDLRQDLVMEQVFRLVNSLLSSHVQTRRRRLRVRTYNVVPFTPCVGLVQWVENTTSIGDYLSNHSSGAHIRYAHPEQKWKVNPDIQRYLIECVGDELEEKYKEVTADLRPVFRHFFTENFADPSEWYHRRTAYTRSVAVGSIVGYIVGLGDRHCENILIDKESAELIHIDLGVAFDQGRILKTPEIVPFRLTRDIVDAMGVTGVEGVFRRCCEETIRVLRNNKEMLLTVLEVICTTLFKTQLPTLNSHASKSCFCLALD